MVLDASTALAWCFPDEASDRANAVLLASKARRCSCRRCGLDIANALLVGERQKRLHQPEVFRFLTLLESLPVVEDSQTAAERSLGCPPMMALISNWRSGAGPHWAPMRCAVDGGYQ